MSRLKHLSWPPLLALLACSCGGGGDAAPSNPATAPGILTQPASLTVNEGRTASFTVVATGNPAPTYQWRKNGNPIPGAVAEGYTTPATTGADSGAQFTVVVANPAGSVDSSAAILTVNTRPAITTPPASLAVVEGQAASFTVVATGHPVPTCQWRKNGAPIPGATLDSYTTPPATLADSGAQYTVAVTNVVDTVVSPAATLTVQPAVVPPTITAQPQGRTVDAGDSVLLHVAASGTAPCTFQWRKDGAPLAGAMSEDCAIANAQAVHAGSYTVTVANAAGSTTSDPAVLVVRPAPPLITAQPLGQTAYAGSVVTFHVAATGTSPFTYQWKLGGSPIAGATRQDYTIGNVKASHAGSYTVSVTNAVDATTSSIALLTVLPATAPAITAQPRSQTVSGGDPVTFSVAVTGTSPFSYQWRKNGTSITGAVFSTYTITGAQPLHGGSYSVVASNSVGSTTSDTAELTVQVPPVGPSITTQPESQTVEAGDLADFSLEATGTAPLSYQWRKDGTSIGGATNATFYLPAAQYSDQGAYTVEVSNQVGHVLSSPAVLTVQPAVSRITTFYPLRGDAGISVAITGRKLTGATAVRFNGAAASDFVVESSARIRAVVPEAATSGPISVTTPLGTAVSADSFVTGGPGLDLWIQKVYIDQAAQNLDGSVPLIQGRNGLLRVFALANKANNVRPDVKVQIFNGDTEVWSTTIVYGGSYVPTALDEGDQLRSWNVPIPGSLLVPGLSLRATLDPADTVVESSKSNNTWPSSGSTELNIMPMADLLLTLVPLKVGGRSSQLIAAGGAGQAPYVDMIPRVLPVSTFTASVHAEVTSSVGLACDGTGWDTLLEELTALWAAEGRTGNYYGLFSWPISGSCIVGLGWLGTYPAAIGWDDLTVHSGNVSTEAAETIAHELGHNLGYAHTACTGDEAAPDPSYPYPGGGIGTWGYDTISGALRSPIVYKDLMSYCRPYWISGYSYRKMLLWRYVNQPAAALQPAPETPHLLVWGHSDGETTVLQPAFTTNTRTCLPAPGDNRLIGLDASGRELFCVSFAMTPMADSPNPRSAGFVMTLPLVALDTSGLTELRVVDARQRTTRSLSRAALAPFRAALQPAATLQATPAGGARLRWDKDAFPLAVVRDLASGQIIGFLRDGVGDVTGTRAVAITFSDGVRSHTVEMPVKE